MAVSPQSQALRDTPGYVSPPATTTAVTPSFPAVPTVPTLAPLDPRAPNTAGRDWLLQQLGPLSTQNNAALTNIQAGAKLQLAGYGGWKFGVDNPATPEREDLALAFDPKSGPGEKEKQAFRGVDNQSNAQGLYYSSFHNQGLASAAQRLSLEGQQIANQYAFNLNQQHTAYAGQVASIANQWVSLYGADTLWLADNPPPPPPVPVAPAPAAPAAAPVGTPGTQLPGQWAKPPNLQTLSRQYGIPVSQLYGQPLGRNATGPYVVVVRS